MKHLEHSAAQTPLDIVVQSVSDIEGAPLPWVDEDGWVTIRESNVMMGDVNCDGEVNTIDAMFILQHDVGLRQASTQCPPQPDDLYIPNCDVRGDGACDSADALFILQCDLGMPNSFYRPLLWRWHWKMPGHRNKMPCSSWMCIRSIRTDKIPSLSMPTS